MISFIIITNGARLAKTQREIDSIASQGGSHEIIIAGTLPAGLEGYNKFIDARDAAKKGFLGAMRNAGCAASSGDVLVVADDDMVFHPGFVEGIHAYGNDFDALAVKIHNPDGSRYWDWAIRDPARGQYLIDYDQVDAFTYITGGMGIYKRHVWQTVKWSDSISFQQAEDVDFTARLRGAGYRIALNPYCTVTHNDGRYTQAGKWVVIHG